MKVSIDLKGLSVSIAMPMHKDLYPSTVVSLMATIETMKSCGIEYDFLFLDCTYVDLSRNILAHKYLAGKTDCLFWIDSDIVWHPDNLIQLVALSTKLKVVGATYPMRGEPCKFTINGALPGKEMQFRKGLGGCVTFDNIAFGMGFTCVQREVMEKLAAKAPEILIDMGDTPVIRQIFECRARPTELAKKMGVGREFSGEDINFFRDVHALGYDVWLDPSITLGHVGSKVYSDDVKTHLGIE